MRLIKLEGALVFTDGSADPNPGPTGAGAVIYIDGLLSEPILINKAVSSNSSSYAGEIEAIELALEFLAKCTRLISKISIFTDCQSALVAITNNNPHDRITPIRNIEKLANLLHSKGSIIHITWIAGHVGLRGNEMADHQARLGMETAKAHKIITPIAKALVKTNIRRHIIDLWQKKWDTEPEARVAHDILQNVTSLKRPCPRSRKADITVNHLLSGHTSLNDHLYRIGQSPNDSPNCECGQALETIQHHLFECCLYIRTKENPCYNLSRQT